MEGKKKTASGTEKEAALAELDRVERELAELGPDPALEADKKSNAVLDKGKTRPLKEVKYPVAVSASELKKMEIPQIVWIVDRLLPVGVSMIGAPSKYFKSYMALLVMGFTGKDALAWKLQYIKAFNQMEKLIREKGTAAYRISDQEERMTRRTETDAIKEFVEYARAQGSIHADHYYSNCTRLAYKIVGITDKGTAAGSQLDDLSLVEHLIAHTLRTGMAAGRGYKDIYLDCKHRLESMKYLQCTA